MVDQPQSQERGVYNRAGWVIVTAILGVLFLLSGVCALTPSGENIISGMRSRLNITSPLNSNAQPTGSLIDTLIVVNDPTSEPPADSPTAVVEAPTDNPRPTETKRPPTSTPTRDATKSLTATATKRPADLPTATAVGDIPTSTPRPDVTANATANATLVATAVQPDCHCQGVDQVCSDGSISYNSPACGGTGGCQCRGTTRVCPDGSSTPLHPSCVVNNPVCTCQITTCDFTKVPPLCVGVCLETGAACTPGD